MVQNFEKQDCRRVTIVSTLDVVIFNVVAHIIRHKHGKLIKYYKDKRLFSVN